MELFGDEIESEDAVHCADIVAMISDLHQSRSAAKIYLSNVYSGDGDNQIVRKALYESALISFRRAFNSGKATSPGYKRWKISDEKSADLKGNYDTEYQQIWTLSSQCIAHRVLPESGKGKVVNSSTNFGATVQVKFKENAEILPILIVLTERYMEYLQQEFERLRLTLT